MNVLIVESENDEYFIEALIAQLRQQQTDVCSIDFYRHSSLSPKKLTDVLTTALTDVTGRGVRKIGVILDLDDDTVENRLNLVNQCFKNAFKELIDNDLDKLLTSTGEMINIKIDEYITIQFACYFMNVDGNGELETVLKAIKKKDSIFADCLVDSWQPCFEAKGKKLQQKKGEQADISNKDITKLWVDFYKRFDTISKRDDRTAQKTDWKGIWTGETAPNKYGETKKLKPRGADIFDLNHVKLADLNQFLKLFN
jgi:hypothetical protein